MKKQIGSRPLEKSKCETSLSKPLIIIKKKDSIKVVLEARHLSSNTDQSSESRPLEPLETQPAKATGK